MTRQEIIKDIKAHGNLRSVIALLEYDDKEVTRILKNAGLDVFQKVQGRLSVIEEYKTILINALR